ncbi:MAG: dihydrofolate reductase, partial [Phycisphaerales bacterium]|nr:dihydrofolate reductase [Phycisphaerales bacterium]
GVISPEGSAVQITLIAAVSENGVIGRDGELPWRLPADLRRFQRVTRGHQVVMGRRTFESLPAPLPDRRNIVVTNNRDYRAGGITVVHSLDEAIADAARHASSPDETLFILGGAVLYAAALPLADRLDLTRVEARVEGDTMFPGVDWSCWRLIESERHEADDRHAFAYRFERWTRTPR